MPCVVYAIIIRSWKHKGLSVAFLSANIWIVTNKQNEPFKPKTNLFWKQSEAVHLLLPHEAAHWQIHEQSANKNWKRRTKNTFCCPTQLKCELRCRVWSVLIISIYWVFDEQLRLIVHWIPIMSTLHTVMWSDHFVLARALQLRRKVKYLILNVDIVAYINS